jgi:hypothetical protein
MRKKFLTAILLILAVVTGLLLYSRLFKQRPRIEQPAENIEVVQSPAPNGQRGKIESNFPSSNRISPSLLQLSDTNTELTPKGEAFQAAVAEKNVPIYFWGKVVDQDGAPLAGVQIEMSIRQWISDSLGMRGQFPLFNRQTDPGGLFELVGQSGDVLEFKSIKKEGYALSPRSLQTLQYDQSSAPEPNNPILFRMWKNTTNEHLVTFNKDFRIPYDGTPVVFDLLAGGISSNETSGDIRVRLIRNPQNVPFGGKTPYNWTASIEPLNGGIKESNDEFMYRAPEEGYQAKLEINMPASATNWSHRVKISFYFKSRGGQCYGRATTELRTDSQQDTTGFSIDSGVNPSGSRNLQ